MKNINIFRKYTSDTMQIFHIYIPEIIDVITDYVTLFVTINLIFYEYLW